MTEKMTPADFKEISRLLRKARYDDSLGINADSKDTLLGVEMWADRRGDG